MIDRLVVGDMDTNVYLVRTDGGTVLVDAPAAPARILAWLDDLVPDGIDAIVITRGCPDRISALNALVEVTDAIVVAGVPDVAEIAHLTGVHAEGLAHKNAIFGMRVIALTGRTSGGIALVIEEDHALIAADSLFPAGFEQREDATGCATLINDLEKKVFKIYPDDTVIWPSHGDPSTLGAERLRLAEWRDKG